MDTDPDVMAVLTTELIRHRQAMVAWTLALAAHTAAIQEWTRVMRSISDIMERERETYNMRKAVN